MCYLRRQSRDPDLGRQIKTFEFRLDSRQYGAKLAVRLCEIVFAWSRMLVGWMCMCDGLSHYHPTDDATDTMFLASLSTSGCIINSTMNAYCICPRDL